jgi:hypothetical protein
MHAKKTNVGNFKLSSLPVILMLMQALLPSVDAPNDTGFTYFL